MGGALKRLLAIRALDIAAIKLERFPPVRIHAVARSVTKTPAAMVARMPPERRVAALLAFAKTFEITALDEALEVFD